ncbi:MAG: hypothetical protein ACYS26_01385 [Planctomycetota bacterium]|jgi:hypothetical protein
MRSNLLPLAFVGLLAGASLSGCQTPEFAPIQYHEGFAAQPFSAADIRAAHPVGTYTLYRVETSEAPPVLQLTTWTEVDQQGCTMSFEQTLEDGAPVGERIEAYEEWQNLRDHAKWPEIAVNFTQETWEGPEGPFEAWVYETVGKQDDSDVVEVFVFDMLSPGSPVEFTRTVDGEQQFRMALVETNRRKRG